LTRQCFDGVRAIAISAAVKSIRSGSGKKTSKCGRGYQLVDILEIIFFVLFTVKL
jgi:hypothetical protein